MRKPIIRRVEDTIHREAKAAEAADLHAELLERIESPDFDDDLTQRPAAEIIKDLCADLGLSAPDSQNWWKRCTPQDIAIHCERAAAPCRAAIPPRQPASAGPPSAEAEGQGGEPPWQYSPRIRRPW